VPVEVLTGAPAPAAPEPDMDGTVNTVERAIGPTGQPAWVPAAGVP